MSKNARLDRDIDAIELGFVEREATPKFAMKLGIQMHLAGLSLSNTVAILESLGVERVRSTVHNWVHKADLQPDDDIAPNQVAVDETVIRLNDDLYWLYMAVDPDTNDVLHTKLQPTRNHYTAKDFTLELIEKHDLDESLFLVDGLPSLHDACRYHSLRFQVTKHGNRNSVERVFREVKRRTNAFSNSFSNAHLRTADDWLKSFSFAWNMLI
ncbi:IS6 family transposase [Haladaptatus sp. F3-133]|uniref:IS6 family transposase n=1 Tax=Halorutilus salinus TaxID=2487751 RepID=A0A9Q4GHI6_9EURY|nr:IS6 family transposase [Halorutilus salinus]MCX2819937.1 IS6 family transposase [Halorutilus salinus]